MTTKLNATAFDHAKRLIDEDKCVLDDRDDWSEHQPSAADENRFVEQHGYEEYARWYLGVDDDESSDTKAHYKFPYGDFERVHRCGLLAAESRAAQRDYTDIAGAAHELHRLLDERG